MASNSFVLGSPRFGNEPLRNFELSHGGASAWGSALDRPVTETAAGARGHFAAAVGDERRKVLAVDRFAAETVCYSLRDGLLQADRRADVVAGPDAEIDPQALYDYFYFHAIPAPRTVFKGVHRLPAAHCAEFADGHLTVSRYWTPTFEVRPVGSLEEAKQQFRALVAAAVERELDGSRPACFLSGGTDSSTVAGMIGQVAGKPAATYSIGFDAQGYDEMEYARIAARHFGTEHHEYYVTPEDLVRGIPAMAAHLDQPFGNSSVLPAYYCALRAREDGVTRLLAGDGGDELFGGNTRYAKQRVFGAYEAAPALVRRLLLDPLADSGVFDRVPLLRKGASYVRQARVPMPGRMQTYNLLHRLGIDEVFTPGFLASIDLGSPARQEQEVWDSCGDTDLVNRMLAFDWRYTLADNDLPKVRAAVELAGVSVGFPLLDLALADFAATLPPSFKVRGSQLRWFFKEALRGFLPDAILKKKKHGFGLPFGVWTVQHDGLRALAQDSLQGFAARGIVRPQFVGELMSRHLPEHPGFYGEMVWILLMLEQWLRHHAPGFRVER